MFPIQGRIDFPSSWVTTLVNLEPTNLAQVPKKPERLPCHYFREVDEDSLLGLVFSSKREGAKETERHSDRVRDKETERQKDREAETRARRNNRKPKKQRRKQEKNNGV